MSKTRLINIHHKVPYTRYIGRGSDYGNPFSHLEGTKALYKVETRDEALTRYREWFESHCDIKKAYDDLYGETLGCFCCPKDGFGDKLLCHGQILIELIEEYHTNHVQPKENTGGA